MLNLLRKIIRTGIVTEAFDDAAAMPRFRGAVETTGKTCVACGKCVEACPVQAIRQENGDVAVDQKACLFCGRCVEVCEQAHLTHSGTYCMAELGGPVFGAENGAFLKKQIRSVLGRSMQIRHVDAGSCNACDWEMTALNNPVYDLQQYGIDFVASPRHADLLMVTGTVTRNLEQALQMTYEATPFPKLVMAVGACAASGRTFGSTYAIRGGVDRIIPVDIYVPGCPPRPQAMIYALLMALDRL